MLVIGSGMYVTGRGGTGHGVILAALAQASRGFDLGPVTIASRDPGNAVVVAEATERINGLLGTSIQTRFRPVGSDPGRAVDELLAEGPFDAAIVSVPDHLHYPYADALLDAGLHTLVVKPLVATLDEHRRLLELQESRRVYAAVEFHKRYDEANQFARRVLREGRLGQPLYITVDYSQHITVPLETFRNWAHRTNIFQYLAVHYVDLIHFLTGYRPVRASAVGTSGVLKKRGLDTWDSVHATIVWAPSEGGPDLVSQFAVNWIDPTCTSAVSDQKYKVIGTAGRLEVDNKDRGIELVIEGEGIRTVNPYFAEYLHDDDLGLRFQGYGHTSVTRFLRDVRDLSAGRVTLEGLRATRPSLFDTLASTAVIEAVNQSLAATGEWRPIDALPG